jgi:tryptophan halogenase
VRDFIILHYCTSQRDDTDFWRRCNNMDVPQSLKEKLAIFRQRGQLAFSEDDLFVAPSWHSILEGMNIRPQKYHPLVDALDGAKLALSLNQGAKAIRETAMCLPTHGEFIEQHCAVK